MSKGFDATGDCAPHAGAIKAAGYSFVGRYYSHSHWKNLTVAEAQQLSAAGIAIVAVWESAGDHAAFFSSDQGSADGEAAVAMAHAIGQPEGTPIYFAVDFDAGESDLTDRVVPYFKSAHAIVRAAGYDVGIYGSGLSCKTLLAEGYVSYTWLAQSRGWGGTADFTAWNIKQGDTISFAGMSVDPDVTNGHGGGFKVPVP